MNLPATDVAQFLLDNGFGLSSSDDSSGSLGGLFDWAVNTEHEPKSPIRCISIFSLPEGTDYTFSTGRSKTTERVGVQVRVRGMSDREVWEMMERIRDVLENKGPGALDTDKGGDNSFVRYHNFTISMGPMSLGKTQGDYNVWVVTLRSLREVRLG